MRDVNDDVLLNRSRATALMVQAGLDALVVTSRENVEYVTGYRSSSQWAFSGTGVTVAGILPRDESLPIALVLGVGELDVLAEYGSSASVLETYGSFVLDCSRSSPLSRLDRRIVQLRSRRSHRSAGEALRTVLRRIDIEGKPVAFESTGVTPAARTNLLNDGLAACSATEGFELIREIRQIKTPVEVQRLAEAAAISEAALSEALDAAFAGASEFDASQVFRRHALNRRADTLHAVILFGQRGALPDGISSSDSFLRPGDTIKADVGTRFKTYTSDMGRTAVHGNPATRLKTYYRALAAGHARAREMIRPGAVPSEIFRTAVETVRAEGIPHYKRAHVGHGIGLEVYEEPMLAPHSARPLEAGMVVNLETPYYELGWAGLQLEDTMHVTAHGATSLTEMSRHLTSALVVAPEDSDRRP